MAFNIVPREIVQDALAAAPPRGRTSEMIGNLEQLRGQPGMVGQLECESVKHARNVRVQVLRAAEVLNLNAQVRIKGATAYVWIEEGEYHGATQRRAAKSSTASDNGEVGENALAGRKVRVRV